MHGPGRFSGAIFAALCFLAIAPLIVRAGNALVPGAIEVVPTILCAGITWNISGDDNRNATGTLEFREKGKTNWNKTLPMWRMFPQAVDRTANTVGGIPVEFLKGLPKWSKDKFLYLQEHYKWNYFAGSIFNLNPGTAYEARITLADPDGGGATKTLSFTTRVEPVIPKTGQRMDVKGGGHALAEAVARARPGDIFRVHAGTYRGFTVDASGTPANPICIVADKEGEVIIQGDAPEKEFAGGQGTGIEIRGSHVWIQGLRIRSFENGIEVKKITCEDVAVMRCTISGCWDAIRAGGRNGYFADNTITGIKAPPSKMPKDDDWSEAHGLVINDGVGGKGNIICYNQVTRVADLLRAQCSDSDVYGNNCFFNADDGIELDEGGPNLRVWGNRWSYTGNNGISFQPYIGGPAYIIRNIVHNCRESPIKQRYKSCGAILINNTFIAAGDVEKGTTDLIEQTYARNNLFLTGQKIALKYHVEDFLRSPHTLDLDYNGYNGTFAGHMAHFFGAAGKPYATILTLAQFQSLTGLERHGVLLTMESCMADKFPDQAATDKAINETWTAPKLIYALAKGSPAIDKGIVIPNIVETFVGAAPDLGALEFGAPLPHWGVRPESNP